MLVDDFQISELEVAVSISLVVAHSILLLMGHLVQLRLLVLSLQRRRHGATSATVSLLLNLNRSAFFAWWPRSPSLHLVDRIDRVHGDGVFSEFSIIFEDLSGKV